MNLKRVVKVTRTILPEPIPVYDLTSHKNENFVLANGCVVHNSAKKARCNDTQAIFPLRGKPLNVMDAAPEKIVNNTEVQTILAAIGVDIASDTPTKGMPYGSIILMADADVDGKHITTLLLTVFYKFAPQLFTEGKIYVLKGPEYLGRYKGKTVFGDSKKSIVKKLGLAKEHKSRAEIRHIKGWGEMNPEDLAIAAMEPETRVLYQIKPVEGKEGINFELLMGKKPDYRKTLLGVSSSSDNGED